MAMRSNRSVRVLFEGLLVLLLFTAGLAGAHAVVVESSPGDNEVLARSPREVVLRFDARIEKSLTRLSLTTSDGRTIPLPQPADKYGEDPDRLVIPLPGLGPGHYILRYKVLSTDGHATPGLLRFSVAAEP